MRKIRKDIYFESKYPGVSLGVICSREGLLLIDSPFRIEDAKDWLAQVSTLAPPRFLALLDHHPERALGARHFNLPILAQDKTLYEMQSWPDSFKGTTRPLGAETDQLKRFTGVGRSSPEISFSTEMALHLPEREVQFQHRPGPTPGSIWVIVPDVKVIFIGDTVAVSEPPYLGKADLPAWMGLLDELRKEEYGAYALLSSRDGLVRRDALNQMARFLRKIPQRLKKLWASKSPVEETEGVAKQLVRDFKPAAATREQMQQRLHAGLAELYARMYPLESI